MKIIDIALKDLTRSMRSTFAVLFMFGVPLIVTGMFYFMFGNIANDDNGFNLPVTRIALVNLDEGGLDMQLDSSMLGMPSDQSFENLGEIIAASLQNEALVDLLALTLVDDSASAREMVDQNEVDVAVIIPPDFTSRFAVSGPNLEQSEIELYANPEKIIELGILQSILQQFTDAISGAKIAALVAVNHIPGSDYSGIGEVVQSYLVATAQRSTNPQAYIAVQSTGEVETPNRMLAIIGPIMTGMMIFYAFYTGMTTAETILREDEEGTLPRLFTTPTSRTAVLAGKFLAVALTVLVQMVVLIIAARLIFQIQWGDPLYVALITLGVVLAASTFGVFANSLIKSTKQGGLIYGGVLTVTGMLGMIKIFTMNVPNPSPVMETVSLLVPQGWAMRGFILSSTSAYNSEILITFAVLLIWSIVFFSIGAWRFHRRFA
jgi:ABC-2 type transport system permease protein